jgi:hypothetical protein
VFRLLGGLPGYFLQMAGSCAWNLPTAPPAVPILAGESGFSPDTVRPTLGPAQRAGPSQRRGAVTGGLDVVILGVPIAESVAYTEGRCAVRADCMPADA